MELSKFDFSDCCEELKLKFSKAIDRIEELENILNDYNLDQEISKRNQEIQCLKDNPILFSENQRRNHQLFIAKHKEKCYNKHGHYIYDVEFASEGTAIKIKCPICQEEIDL